MRPLQASDQVVSFCHRDPMTGFDGLRRLDILSLGSNVTTPPFGIATMVNPGFATTKVQMSCPTALWHPFCCASSAPAAWGRSQGVREDSTKQA